MSLFDKAIVQAVSDWQRGGDAKQKAKRGQALKAAAAHLPAEFRESPLVCFRQIALRKGALWELADTLSLPETISAWTLSRDVARTIKGGVPPPIDFQGVIFALHPPGGAVIANLDRLYRDADFQKALAQYGPTIPGFSDGAGRYGNRQAEVVLEISRVRLSDIEELGGYSSTIDDLMREFFEDEPTTSQKAWFVSSLQKTGLSLGAAWVDGEARDRVLKKVADVMPELRTLKSLSAASP